MSLSQEKSKCNFGICSCGDKLCGAPGWETGLLVLSQRSLSTQSLLGVSLYSVLYTSRIVNSLSIHYHTVKVEYCSCIKQNKQSFFLNPDLRMPERAGWCCHACCPHECTSRTFPGGPGRRPGCDAGSRCSPYPSHVTAARTPTTRRDRRRQSAAHRLHCRCCCPLPPLPHWL